MNDITLWRRLLAEFLGSAFLAALVIGSGIAFRGPAFRSGPAPLTTQPDGSLPCTWS